MLVVGLEPALQFHLDVEHKLKHSERFLSLIFATHIKGFAQDCGNSSADALELPQSCAKPLI